MQLIPLLVVSTFFILTILRLSTSRKIGLGIVISILIFHTFASFLYIQNPGDWIMYSSVGQKYAESNYDYSYFRIGTQFVVAIIHFLCSVTLLTAGELFYIFQFFGFLGIIYLYISVKDFIVIPRDRLLLLLFFLPGMHFWTSALGKDSLIFYPLGYLLYALTRSKLSVVSLIIPLSLIFLIRPHVAFVAILSLGLSVLYAGNRISGIIRFIIPLALIILVGALLPILMEFVGLGDTSLDSIEAQIERRAGYNQHGGGAVDITQYNPLLRLLTYLFRPFFFDANGLTGMAASIENLVYLCLFLPFFSLKFLRYLKDNKSVVIYFSLFFSMMMWIMLGMTTANLGIAVRQKVMFLPFLLYLFFSFRDWRLNQQTRINKNI